MSIYGIGFVLAIVLYFIYVFRNEKRVTSDNLIIGIVLGILSWFGVIIGIVLLKRK
jgi:hypothetical protein